MLFLSLLWAQTVEELGELPPTTPTNPECCCPCQPSAHAALPRGICDIRPAVICNNIGIKLASLSCREVSGQGPWLIQQARGNRSLPALGKENKGVCLQSLQLIQTAFLNQRGKGPWEQMGKENFPTRTECCSLGTGECPHCRTGCQETCQGLEKDLDSEMGHTGAAPALGHSKAEQVSPAEPLLSSPWRAVPAPHLGWHGASHPQPWGDRVLLSCHLQRVSHWRGWCGRAAVLR